MQSAIFLISATTGCVKDLKSALEENKRVRSARRVVSGEYDIIALVVSDELGDLGKELSDLVDFQESLGALHREEYDEEHEQLSIKKFVHKVSFNLLFPDSDSNFAMLSDSPRYYPPRGRMR